MSKLVRLLRREGRSRILVVARLLVSRGIVPCASSGGLWSAPCTVPSLVRHCPSQTSWRRRVQVEMLVFFGRRRRGLGGFSLFSCPSFHSQLLTMHRRQLRLAVGGHAEDRGRRVPTRISSVGCPSSLFVPEREGVGGLDPVVDANDYRLLRLVYRLPMVSPPTPSFSRRDKSRGVACSDREDGADRVKRVQQALRPIERHCWVGTRILAMNSPRKACKMGTGT